MKTFKLQQPTRQYNLATQCIKRHQIFPSWTQGWFHAHSFLHVPVSSGNISSYIVHRERLKFKIWTMVPIEHLPLLGEKTCKSMCQHSGSFCNFFKSCVFIFLSLKMKRWITKTMVCAEHLLSFWEPWNLLCASWGCRYDWSPIKALDARCLRGSPNRQHLLFPVTTPSWWN